MAASNDAKRVTSEKNLKNNSHSLNPRRPKQCNLKTNEVLSVEIHNFLKLFDGRKNKK